ncbi:putative ankyrin repeat protein RF_0381, partial [Xenia sp. Carnegie-2017]|uniref:putative ankyrin repeat protein RF_0381 n=1 Tax=Xenia sp. Carnegie-2017 TaxID=2897299 RepID=UPI001F03C385
TIEINHIRNLLREQRKYVADETIQLQEKEISIQKYSSSCFNIYQACVVGDLGSVQWYINDGHEDVNKPDENGTTPLFYSIQKNQLSIVKELIKAGADVNMVASLEEGINVTPVHVAVKFNRCECLKILLNHGADANVPNQFGQTPLHSAVRRKLRDLVNMLLKNGANVNITDHDMVTPLHLAASPGSNKDIKEVVKMMIDNGANPLCEDSEGNTVFHEAAENGSEDVLDVLFEYQSHHTFPSFNVTDVLNKPRKDGNNCFHLAVKGHVKAVDILYNH